MFWWFQREGQYLRYEARRADRGFEFCIIDVDGSEHVEHFDDSAALAKRQQEFEREIRLAGWSGPHGWNL